MIALYIIVLLACFVLLARIVDLFFISSLDKISKDLRLSSDAAGATLMAVGSSAPELFVHCRRGHFGRGPRGTESGADTPQSKAAAPQMTRKRPRTNPGPFKNRYRDRLSLEQLCTQSGR